MGVSLGVDVERDLPLIVGIEGETPAAEAGLQVRTRSMCLVFNKRFFFCLVVRPAFERLVLYRCVRSISLGGLNPFDVLLQSDPIRHGVVSLGVFLLRTWKQMCY